MIENHEDDITRELIMANFTMIFEQSQEIPVGILIDPLVK
jgi:hypothetical protein